jgi:DNA-binding MarR family transcriptional regulator
MNRSDTERFELAYGRVWGTLHRPDDPDLSQHERQLLHHIPAQGGVPLTWLARHLALPKSTASVLIKDLSKRGFVKRARDAADERRLALVLTAKGRRRVEADSVLEPEALAAALAALPERRRTEVLEGLESLANAADQLLRGQTP